jgi:gamma-glutamylcyclotransferase (GGCT)/AIG2-like uncharacterized protein YtfP
LRSSVDEPCWVFAYGSNMDVDHLRDWLDKKGYRLDGLLRVEPATLAGYRLVWNYYSKSRNGGAANVEPCEGREISGLALSVDPKTLKAIDQKEGHPTFYSRGSSQLTARLNNGEEIGAWLYVVVHTRCENTPVWPRREYLELLIKAARKYGLPAGYIGELEATSTAD